jgi:hypothetical protein
MDIGILVLPSGRGPDKLKVRDEGKIDALSQSLE